MSDSLERRRKMSRYRWKVKELKAIISVLYKSGHEDINEFTRVLPKRSKTQIARYLNILQSSVKKNKRTQESHRSVIARIHPWLPFINSLPNMKSEVCDNLVPFSLSLVENVAVHPKKEEYGGVDFKSAYKALFNSLTSDEFPKNINKETVAMMSASLQQLLRRTDPVSGQEKKILRNCLTQKKSDALLKKSKTTQNMTLPREVNVLNLRDNQLNIFCKPKA